MTITDYVLLTLSNGKEVIAKEVQSTKGLGLYLDPLSITVITNGIQSTIVMTRYTFFAEDNMVTINPDMVESKSEPSNSIINIYEMYLKVIRSKTDAVVENQWQGVMDALEAVLYPQKKSDGEDGEGGGGDDAHLKAPPEQPSPEEASMLTQTKKINDTLN